MAILVSPLPKNYLETELEIKSPPVRLAFTAFDASSSAAAAWTPNAASGIDTSSSVSAASTSGASPASSFSQNHLETEIEIESPSVRPAFTATDASSPAAAACTPTAAYGIDTSSSVAAASTSGASPARSFPQNYLQTEIEIEGPAVRPAFTAIDASSPAAAASTSGAADPNCRYCHNYAVFLNHHGEDVKNTFGSHVYHRLRLEGIQVFLDRPELQKGKYFPDQIRDVIKNCCVHVAIFSPRYTESEWCLNELVDMLNTKADIIPVFYKVEPCELAQTRNADGVYARGLRKLEKETTHDPQTHEEKQRFNSTTIANWGKALHRASEISGFKLDEYNGDEGVLVEKVVEAVLKRIKETGLYVAKNPTGLDVKVKDFEDTVLLLQQQQQKQSGKPQVVGIVGMCGIGKSTFAKQLFNRKSSYYGRSFFLPAISENASKSSLSSCQKELLNGLIQPDFHIESIHKGIEMLKRQLSSSNAFIVLDGVDHASDLDAFLPVLSVLRSDSLILITSRDKNVLTGSGVQNKSIYKLTGLDAHCSIQLFCSHAFGHSHPLPEFKSLVEKFSEACEGSPLSLKLSGELVCGKDARSDWEDQFDRLPQILLRDMRDRLKSSYDGLQLDEKEAFLDIAYFFTGERRDMAIRIWEGLGLRSSLVFQNLVNKSLVEVDSECIIKMYNHVRDMGREEPSSPSGFRLRLRRPTEIMDNLPHQSYGKTGVSVRGIRMPMDDKTDSDDDISEMSCYTRWSRELFCNRMVKSCNNSRSRGTGPRKVQLLDTKGHLLKRILRIVHSTDLIWLRWLKCPYYSLPSWLPMENLRVLHLSGVLKTLWQCKSGVPLQLRELVIDSPLLKSLPASFGNLKKLEHLDLSNSYHLQNLPNSFGDLENLKHLNLSHSHSLQKLPIPFGNLRNLEHLDLSNSYHLQNLPNSFGDLENLKHLNLSHSHSLQKLPDSFGNLRNLEHLDLSYSHSLQELPNPFGDLTQLKHLDLSYSSSLQKLPDSFCNLRNLEHLDISYCRSLHELPNSIGNLTQLEHLNLSYCSSLQKLPNSFTNLNPFEFLIWGVALI